MGSKAFALTGRLAVFCLYPGRCPGLGASALSGRVGQNLSGRAASSSVNDRNETSNQ